MRNKIAQKLVKWSSREEARYGINKVEDVANEIDLESEVSDEGLCQMKMCWEKQRRWTR